MALPTFPYLQFRSGRAAYLCTDLAATAGSVAVLAALPFSLRVLLDNLLRAGAAEGDVAALLAVNQGAASDRGVAFRPSRVLLQDLAGIPALVDLAALRDAVAARGGDPDGHFRPRRHLMSAGAYRTARDRAFRVWRQETCVQSAAWYHHQASCSH